MALILKDRVRESTVTSGTGTITLDGAVSGFQSFSVIGNTNTTYYAIVDVTTGAWEVGVGTYSTSGPTLTRDSVFESSNSGNLVNFTSNIKDVFCTYPAEQAVTLNDVQTLTNKTLTSPAMTDPSYTGTLTGGTGVVNLGSGQVYKDASGNVGIGTSSPVSALELSTSDQALGATLSITNGFNGTDWNTGDVIGTINFRSNDTSTTEPIRGSIKSVVENTSGATSPAYTALTFSTASVNTLTERMRLDSSGNLGLGVTPSAWGSSYKSIDLAQNGSVSSTSASNNINVSSNVYRNSSAVWTYKATDYATSYQQISGQHIWNTAPSGTAGNAISFTQAMTLNASGNLGIGTSSPQSSAKLHVYAAGDYTDEAAPFTLGSSSTGDMRLYAGVNNTSDYTYIGSVRSGQAYGSLVLQPNGGNVGIGTSSPSNKLTVSGTGTVGRLISSNTGVYFGLQTSDANGVYLGSVSNSMVFQTNDTERMRIDSSGNVGIGTSSPVSYRKLTLQSNGSAGGLALNNSAGTLGAQFTLENVSTSTDLGIYATGTMNLYTGGTERARIDSSGNLLVGTTTAGGRLAVTAGSASQSPIVTNSVSGDTAFQAILVTKFDNNTTTSQNFIQFQVNNGAANCGRITANGANTAAFGSTSDSRVKENIADLPSQLNNILALRPVEFDYIEELGGGHQIGFIAQEMQQVYPDCVSGDGTEDNILSITGWSKTEARLVKALQEAVAEINQLKARLDAANL